MTTFTWGFACIFWWSALDHCRKWPNLPSHTRTVTRECCQDDNEATGIGNGKICLRPLASPAIWGTEARAASTSNSLFCSVNFHRAAESLTMTLCGCLSKHLRILKQHHHHHQNNLLWRHSTGAQQRLTNSTVHTM